MPYRYTHFDTVALPQVQTVDDLSVGVVGNTIVNSLDRGVDGWGAERHLPREQRIRYKGMYIAEPSTWVTETGTIIVSPAAELVTASDRAAWLVHQVDSIKAKIGRVGKLWRMKEWGRSLSWKTVRLLDVRHDREVKDAGQVARLDLSFVTLDPFWRAETPVSYALGLSPGSNPLQVTLVGSEDIYDAIITIQATTNISGGFTLSGAGHGWYYATPINAGIVAVIDSGRESVLHNGNDNYFGFNLQSGHTNQSWLTLVPGVNTLTATVVSGTGSITFSYYEQAG